MPFELVQASQGKPFWRHPPHLLLRLSSSLRVRRKSSLLRRDLTSEPNIIQSRPGLAETSQEPLRRAAGNSNEVLMRSVRLDDTGSSKGLRAQHPMSESSRLQSVVPTESPFPRGGCYSPHGTDALLTFPLSRVSQLHRWARALPSCTFEPRAAPPEEVPTRFSRRSRVSIRQSPGRTPKSPPNPLEVVHLLSSLYRRVALQPASWPNHSSRAALQPASWPNLRSQRRKRERHLLQHGTKT